MKKLLSVFLLILLAAVVIGCSSDSASQEEETDSSTGNDSRSEEEATTPDNYRISMVTGTTTGTYYPLGAIFSDFWNKKLDFIQASSQATNGSVQNLQFIKQGEAQLGLTPIGTLYEGYYGLSGFEGNKIANVTILAGLYPNVNHLVVRKGTKIGSISELSGKKIVPGATGSATEIETQHTLAAHGVDFDSMKVNYVGFTEATDLMRNNQVDAAMVMAGVPTSAVTEMLATADGALLNYTDEGIANLKEDFPWTTEYTIEAGSYENQPDSIKTVAQFNFLVAPADMPEDVAYELVKTFWENIDELIGSHAVVEQFDVQNALQGVGDIPVHPGAQKYYDEVGVSK